MDNLWAINDKFMEICVAKRSVYFRRTHVKVQALDMPSMELFAEAHQAEANVRYGSPS